VASEYLFRFLLVIHVVSGFMALMAAFAAIAVAKGQAKHRLFGKIFLYAMTGVMLTAIPLAISKNNLFLFLIAIFSYYLAFSGWRYAVNRDGQAKRIDKAASYIMLLAALFMLTTGSVQQSLASFERIILMVFGLIGAISSVSDLRTYANKSAKGKVRIAKHLGAMFGATVATVTAFSVTNIHLPPLVVWLAPTVIFIPIIVWWKRRVLSKNF